MNKMHDSTVNIQHTTQLHIVDILMTKYPNHKE